MMMLDEFAPRRVPRAYRRPAHRPDFDALESRVLLTAPVAVTPLPGGNGYSTSLVADGNGNLWFLRFGRNELDRLAPDGSLTKITLGTPPDPSQFTPNDLAFNALTIGPDNNVWVNGLTRVDRVTPDGVVTSFATGAVSARLDGSSPSTIASGPDGALWFGGIFQSIGRITTDGAVTLFPVEYGNGVATSIAPGSDGGVYFSVSNEIERIDGDGTIRTIAHSSNGEVFNAILGPDGNIWFFTVSHQIGKVTPDGRQTYYSLPAGYPFPGRLTAGPDSGLWFAESWAGRIDRIGTDGVLSSYPISRYHEAEFPSGPYPTELAFGEDGTLSYSNGRYALVYEQVNMDGNSWTPFKVVPSHEIDRIAASDFLPIVAQAASTSPSADLRYDGPLASFSAVVSGDGPGDYLATIDWGDGSTSAGVVVADGLGSFQVDGSHDYVLPGIYAASVTLRGRSATPLPLVIPAVVENTLIVGGATEPNAVPTVIPAPAASDASGSPVTLEFGITALAPSGPGSIPIADVPRVAPSATRAANPTASSTLVTLDLAARSVSFDPTASMKPSTSGASTVVPFGTSLNSTARATRPVPTLGLTTPTVPRLRRGSVVASTPNRLAMAILPESLTEILPSEETQGTASTAP